MASDAAPQRLGRYRILGEIGRGGMATVYHAIQEGPHGFENHVALKLIHERLLEAHPRVVKMLVDEARVAARIHHPNVLRILDLVEQENRVYMVMDFVDGISMRGVLDHARETKIPAKIAPVIEVLVGACEGIHAAHQLKSDDGTLLHLVHRDMKPGNIMVSLEGHVKVGDFGIALFADRVADSTAQGQLKGTPAYMSPEQTLGGPLDARSDVFSMGLTLYTLATNKLAFRARKAMQIALMIARESMEPHAVELENIAPGLGDVFRKACSRDPDERYQDATQLGEALHQVYERLENPQSIPDMLKAAGCQRGVGVAAETIEEPLARVERPSSSLLVTSDPIDGPEESELTQTESLDENEADTHTYIPTLTELNTDLDSTPLSSSKLERTEELTEAPEEGREDEQPAPAQALEPKVLPPQHTTLKNAKAFDPNATAAAAGPVGLTRAADREKSVRHDRDYRGRRIPTATAEQTRIGQGEKLGITIASAFLVLAIVAIVGYQFVETSEQNNEAPTTEPDNTKTELIGGVAIAEREGEGRIEDEEYIDIEDQEVEIVEDQRVEIVEDQEVEIVEDQGVKTVEDQRVEIVEDQRVEVVEDPEVEIVEDQRVEIVEDQRVEIVEDQRVEIVEEKKAPATRVESVSSKVEPSTTEQEEEAPATPVEPGLITVSSYPWSEVWIDNEKVGAIPLTEHQISAGVHTIRLVFPTAGNKELIEKIEIRPGKHLRIVRKMETGASQSTDSDSSP
jgi:serine/threonine protein kinase